MSIVRAPTLQLNNNIIMASKFTSSISSVPVDHSDQLKSIFICILILDKMYLIVTDLPEVLQLLRRHGYSGDRYYGLGLYLGLSPATLDIITLNNYGDIDGCLYECLKSWLQRADGVQYTKGGPTIHSLVSALRGIGEKRIAEGIDMESKC